MGRKVGIGLQNFEKIRENNCFYIDKTGFIKEWWENQDDVTLITRPRRFGRYDVMLEPRDMSRDDAMLLEFKVQDREEEKELADTVQAALSQIERKKYKTALLEKGIPGDRIRKYPVSGS